MRSLYYTYFYFCFYRDITVGHGSHILSVTCHDLPP